MGFWSGEKLLENQSVVDNFCRDQVDANAYNLRMGSCYFRTSDGRSEILQTKTFLSDGQPFLIPPGQFAFLMTRETINVPPDAMAFISMRTGMKFQGLINVSGFHVDPGYSGKLIYAIYNASPSPVQICEGDAIFKIWFASLDRPSGPEHLFVGKAQNDIGNDLIRGMSKEIYSLQTLAEMMRDLKTQFERELAQQRPVTENLTLVWRAIVVGAIGATILAIFAIAWPSLMAGGKFLLGRFGGGP